MQATKTITGLALAALLAGTAAAAQSSAPAQPQQGAHHRCAPASPEQAAQRLNERLDQLRARLNLQPAQAAAWDAYAGKLQSNLLARHKLHESRPAKGDREALADYRVTVLKFNAQAADETNQARKALAATLSPEQKSAFDAHVARDRGHGHARADRSRGSKAGGRSHHGMGPRGDWAAGV